MPITDISMWGSTAAHEIKDFTGINLFKNLVRFYCISDELTSLEISDLPSLLQFDCYNDTLTSLTVSNCQKLDNTIFRNLYWNKDVSGFSLKWDK
ncbi:hypothetical protein Hs30E_18920 [Lactococcus hodotermopsidis]|uniref:Internalin n=1 Tax=Pseudolactococcus hodotermopsidis TaxID=2709157 RepID=A0A6A0BGF0_9LACT|nr:hypothetical protein [Lactococcus hodotermopsidis]GFH43341.1 hypothetical protein Hs30E_18920 [Lactococcus hodotermopsidis]